MVAWRACQSALFMSISRTPIKTGTRSRTWRASLMESSAVALDTGEHWVVHLHMMECWPPEVQRWCECSALGPGLPACCCVK
jgi:hypothetical protein